jgi:hypothetical protein
MFPIVRFLAQKFWVLLDLKLKQKIFFSLVGILTNLKRCCLQIENWKKLIFVNKIWLNNPRIGCKSPSNLVEFLEKDINIEKGLAEFEGEFENDEIVEM